jgi:hypothetical protein
MTLRCVLLFVYLAPKTFFFLILSLFFVMSITYIEIDLDHLRIMTDEVIQFRTYLNHDLNLTLNITLNLLKGVIEANVLSLDAHSAQTVQDADDRAKMAEAILRVARTKISTLMTMVVSQAAQLAARPGAAVLTLAEAKLFKPNPFDEDRNKLRSFLR